MNSFYFRSPLNYLGNKYRLLNQLFPLFPQNINTFVDLFCGGCVVGINAQANQLICNDSNEYLIDMFNKWKADGKDNTMTYIHNRIKELNLSWDNKAEFYQLRDIYNAETRNPNDLFLLSAYGFNNQIRFNSLGNYNIAFGGHHAYYNKKTEEALLNFLTTIENYNDAIQFEHKDYVDLLNSITLTENDFVYADPPYRIADHTTYHVNWTENDDKQLLAQLDALHDKGIKFALSNVLEVNGKENKILKEWAQKYHVHHLDMDYSNCNYHKNDRLKYKTDEVLITNY